MEPELPTIYYDDLDVDGMPSTVNTGKFRDLIGAYENESKRKRDKFEENSNSSDTRIDIVTCFDSGQRQDSNGSSSGSSSGSTGLEPSFSDLDLSDGENSTKGVSKNEHDTVQVKGNDESSADRDTSLIKGSAKTKVEIEDGSLSGHIGYCEGGQEQSHSGDDSTSSSTEDGDLDVSLDPLHQPDIEIFAQDEDGDTVLHTAIVCGLYHFAKAIIVLSEQCHLNMQNHLFQTALHLGVLTNQAAIVQALLHAYACFHLRDHQGRTPLHIACEQDNVSLLRLMLGQESSCADMDDRLNTIYPTKHCSAEKSKAFDIPNWEGQCCIHVAAIHNDTDMMDTLLSHGADVNCQDRKSGRTALHLATELGHTGMVKFLLDRDDLTLDKKTRADETAIAIAYVRERKDIYNLLKNKGAKVDFKYFAKFGVATAEIKKRCKTT